MTDPTKQVSIAGSEPSISPNSPPPSACRSSRATKGTYQTIRFTDEVFLASIAPECNPSSTNATLTYGAELDTDFDTGEINCTNPQASVSKFKAYNDDNPSFDMAT